MKIKVVKNILEANDQVAQENRTFFKKQKVFVINLMSSPGAGKTSLLEKTIKELKNKFSIGVIEGDLQGTLDAKRIAKLKVPVVQINTEGGCHLSSPMIRDCFSNFNFKKLDLLIIENVGNLVCPADFDLGENIKVTILSTTEGDDKPFKYPYMFMYSKAALINKIDLLPYLNCSVKKIKRDIKRLNHNIKIFATSCTQNTGIKEWTEWLEKKIQQWDQVPSG